jgi:hypothetical protein
MRGGGGCRIIRPLGEKRAENEGNMRIKKSKAQSGEHGVELVNQVKPNLFFLE